MLGDEKIELAVTDSVLAGAGAVEGEGPMDQSFVETLGLGDLARILGLDQKNDMKIPIADVADEGGRVRVRSRSPQAVDSRLLQPFSPKRKATVDTPDPHGMTLSGLSVSLGGAAAMDRNREPRIAAA